MDLQKFTNTTLLDTNVSFAIQNGLWLNATEVAKKYGKRMDNYWRNEEKYIQKVAKSNSLNMSELKNSVRGKYGGTYIHPDLVISFARYCNEDFAIACDKFIKDEIVREHEAKIKALEMQSKAKDKMIEELSKRDKEYRVIVKDGKRFHSATSLMKDEKDTAKAFKKTMREVLDVVKVKMKLTPYYVVTNTGLSSGLVIPDEHGTPYYAEECVDLYYQSKDM